VLVSTSGRVARAALGMTWSFAKGQTRSRVTVLKKNGRTSCGHFLALHSPCRRVGVDGVGWLPGKYLLVSQTYGSLRYAS
jgi:hypothetical protein